MPERKRTKEFLGQLFVFKKIVYCIVFAVIPALLFYSFALYGFTSRGWEIIEVLRDPAQQLGVSSFRGFLSNIGVWMWVSSATISFFVVLTYDVFGKKAFTGLPFLMGVLSILLAIDDLFLIHDRYIYQPACYLTYATLMGVLLVRHYKKIIEIEGVAFFLAGAFLASSILSDLVQSKVPLRYEYVQVIEEGFKFVGAATWLYFTGRVASFFLVHRTVDQ